MNSMRSHQLPRLASIGILGALLSTCLIPPPVASAQRKSSGPPNIIFIMADDLGWRELGAYGNRFTETPHLDRLAAQGVKFTQAYASSPICSPTRAALMTGQYPGRTGITNYIEKDDSNYLRPEYTTINELLSKSGYRSAIIGKWHLTGDYEAGPDKKGLGRPQLHGWDEVIASETVYIGPGDYFHPYFFLPGLPQREPEFTGRKPDEPEYLTDRLNSEAVEFIRRNRERPFFLYLAHYAPHTQLAGKPELLRKYQQKPDAGANARGNYNHPMLAAMVESIDDGVGKIMRALEEFGLSENTLLIFTSDNGGEFGVTNNAPLWGGKSTIYEGGLRVPAIMHWPGRIQAGIVSDVPTNTVDYFPTLLEVAGARPDPRQPVDGESLTPLFKTGGKLRRDTLYWHYPLAKPRLLAARSSGAIRHGDYKLIEFFDTGEIQLFNLRADVGEQWNLAPTLPQKVAELRAMLASWRKQANVSMQPMRPS
jgi:arylsulfatase A